ncbi:neuropilin and tolloid-like protein 1 isoform X2 [Adelges cooleyi]|uniref:neuropilin and tolloid-like protein 1 isoform X2 n=1 Tax=Adelges cooleyi TaxID=133065 RepID=UPI00217FA2CF|nr:neuropilin and tolloid-like protein 1 isoform X2 [Adelges cooleyi]
MLKDFAVLLLVTKNTVSTDPETIGGNTTTIINMIDYDLPVQDMAPESSMTSPCHLFEGEFEFFSPGYPQTYPNNTECIRVITADEGEVIELDFRDSFTIEPSSGCKHDHLEIRDGPYGYSEPAHYFCGNQFPPKIVSKDRSLWLRFRSDENIEYDGFHAVYKFIKKPPTSVRVPQLPACRNYINGSQGYINSTEVDKVKNETLMYKVPLDCMWIIEVKVGWKIQLNFKEFALEKPNDCSWNVVEIFSNRTDMASRLRVFCGSIAEMVQSPGNMLHVRFVAEGNTSKFSALFTAYRTKTKDEVCGDDQYDCEDLTCIASELRCNNVENCRFRWDEDGCPEEDNSLMQLFSSFDIIVILVVFFLILCGMCSAFVTNIVRKLVHDHRIIKEHMRHSREGHLDQIGGISETDDHSVEDSGPQGHGYPHSDNSSQTTNLFRSKHANNVSSSDCYVPSGDLIPVLMKHDPPRLYPSVEDEEGDGLMSSYPITTETKDIECQTRESLFDTTVVPKSTASHYRVRPSESPLNKPPLGFSTFGYRKDTQTSSDATNPSKFRAEAVIEMDKFSSEMSNQRPYSIESTKSAPDVIVMH